MIDPSNPYYVKIEHLMLNNMVQIRDGSSHERTGREGRGWGRGAAAPQFLDNYLNRANYQKLSANTRAKMKPKQYRITRLHTKRAMSNQNEIVFVNISMSKVSITSKLLPPPLPPWKN